MYAESDFVEWSTSQPPQTAAERQQFLAPGAHSPIITPRLVPLPAFAQPPDPQLTIADLRFPAEIVHTHAAGYTEAARRGGARHSMQLWREGCHLAILSLARTATGAADGAACEALFWQLEGDDYHVSITFREAAHGLLSSRVH